MRTVRPVPGASTLAITMAAVILVVAVRDPIKMVIIILAVAQLRNRARVLTIRNGRTLFPAMMRRSSTPILGRNTSESKKKSAIVWPLNSRSGRRKDCTISILTTKGCRNSFGAIMNTGNNSNIITITITIIIISLSTIITIITVTSKMLMFFRAQNSG